jgi:ferric-dicitrate binding protein FerR (iron transport regulator)
VVAELLGSGDPAALRKARRRRYRGSALRVALALALAALLVVAGLNVVGDQSGDRTLYGRTGEVHRP